MIHCESLSVFEPDEDVEQGHIFLQDNSWSFGVCYIYSVSSACPKVSFFFFQFYLFTPLRPPFLFMDSYLWLSALYRPPGAFSGTFIYVKIEPGSWRGGGAS